jgi:hypothetical protein
MGFALTVCHLTQGENMRSMILAAALALAAGCNKAPDQGKPAASADKAPPSQSQVNTPSTPAPGASTGQTASQAEKKEGANPVQGQVDPKTGEQHRDFQSRGDAAGPKGPDPAPKQGN